MKNSRKKQSEYKRLWEAGERARTCPRCCSRIEYKDKWSYIYGRTENKICKSCHCKEQSIKNRDRFSGSGNPFYGKRHSKNTLKKFKNRDVSHLLGDNNVMKSEKMRSHFSKIFSGAGNPMYGRPVSSKTKALLSTASSGKKNPMYGKPSPNGSGNGWASWYKGIHFRSLRELQYYITEIELSGISCENGQIKKFRSKYRNYDGSDRTYHPDFFVGGKYLVEIKPRAMWQTPLVLLKKKAAEKLCKKMGWEYKLVDIEPNSTILRDKYLNGEIIFLKKYKERFEKYAGIK